MTDHIEAVDRRTGEAVTIAGVHPVAQLFPMLDVEGLGDLVESIREQGLLDPIVLDEQGRVLDGRNRLVACQAAGIKPEIVPYEGDDPDGYALTVNITRRHLSKGQQAMVIAKATETVGFGAKARASRQAGVSAQRVSYAVAVLKYAPDLAEGVLAGTGFLDAAYKTAQDRKAAANSTDSKMAELRRLAPDLADLVVEDRMSLDEALAAARKRAEVEQDRRQRFTKTVAQSLMTIYAQLAPDPGEAIDYSWDRDAAATFRNLPGQADRFTAKGVRETARLLTDLAQYLSGLEGKTL